MPDSSATPYTDDPNEKIWFERRRHKRVRTIDSHLILVDLGPQGQGVMLDVGEGGMLLQPYSPLCPTASSTVRFDLPDIGEFESAGKVAWLGAGGRAGVQFLNVPESSRALLHTWLLGVAPSGARAEVPPQKAPSALRGAQRDATNLPTGRTNARTAEHAEEDNDELDLDLALEFAAKRALKITRAQGAAIALGSERGMVCRARIGNAPDLGARLFPDSGLSGLCLRTRKMVLCRDANDNPNVDPIVCHQLNLRSLVIVPVSFKGHLTGVVEVFSSRPNAFFPQDVERLQRLAELIGMLAGEVPSVSASIIGSASEPPAILYNDVEEQRPGDRRSGTDRRRKHHDSR